MRLLHLTLLLLSLHGVDARRRRAQDVDGSNATTETNTTEPPSPPSDTPSATNDTAAGESEGLFSRFWSMLNSDGSGATGDNGATQLYPGPVPEVEDTAEAILNVTEALRQCLSVRLGDQGIKGLDIDGLASGGRRRMRELRSAHRRRLEESVPDGTVDAANNDQSTTMDDSADGTSPSPSSSSDSSAASSDATNTASPPASDGSDASSSASSPSPPSPSTTATADTSPSPSPSSSPPTHTPAPLTCDNSQRYLVLINDSLPIDVLGGTLSTPLVQHGVPFKPLGGASARGCFLTTLDTCMAADLSTDPRISLAIPLVAKMKKPPSFMKSVNDTINGVMASSPSSSPDSTTTSAESPSPSQSQTQQANNATNDTESAGGDATEGSNGVSNAEQPQGNGTASPSEEAQSSNATVENATISLHVTIADFDGVEKKVDKWRATLQKDDVHTDNMTFTLSSRDNSTMGGNRYLFIQNVLADEAAKVAAFFVNLVYVDFIEVTTPLAFMNKWARGVVQSGDWQSAPLTASGLDGSGQVIGVADTGLDTSTCFFSDPSVSVPYGALSDTHRKLVTYIAFADKQENLEKDPNTGQGVGHGTHVSGTLAGQASGASSAFNGMAPSAKLAFFDIAKYDSKGNVMLYPPADLNTDLFKRLYAAGARVMSMSWGSPDSNCYSSYAVMVDEFMWNYPDALVVFAAGNSGTQGAYSVVTPSTAKSCLTVGASYNMMQSTFGLSNKNNINYVAYFSSSGPTADGRIKPEVVAPGYYITSAKAGDTCSVINSRGTSMATPVVAGTAALIRQYFTSGRHENRAMTPSGALLKAMLIHSAQRMLAYEDSNGKLNGMSYPDNHQGYGRIEVDQVIDHAGLYTLLAYGTSDSKDPRYRQLNTEGDHHEYNLVITNISSKNPRPLKVTLVWTDQPGAATACQKQVMSVLSNDLDLMVKGPKGTVYYPLATGGTGPDRYNPSEHIIIAQPQVGANYTVMVTAYGLVTPQNYALVITGQFSGYTYNATSVEFETSPNVWQALVRLLKGEDKAAMFIVAVVLVALALCGCLACKRHQRPTHVQYPRAVNSSSDQPSSDKPRDKKRSGKDRAASIEDNGGAFAMVAV